KLSSRLAALQKRNRTSTSSRYATSPVIARRRSRSQSGNSRKYAPLRSTARRPQASKERRRISSVSKTQRDPRKKFFSASSAGCSRLPPIFRSIPIWAPAPSIKADAQYANAAVGARSRNGHIFTAYPGSRRSSDERNVIYSPRLFSAQKSKFIAT